MDFSLENSAFRARLKAACQNIAGERARELSEDELYYVAAAGDLAARLAKDEEKKQDGEA